MSTNTDPFDSWCKDMGAEPIIRFSSLKPKFNGMSVHAVAKTEEGWIALSVGPDKVLVLLEEET